MLVRAAMQLETFPVGMLGCNCSILVDSGSRRALIIDPGGEVERIQERISVLGATVDAIVYTHAHLDHVAGGRDLQRRFGVPVKLHPADREVHDLLPAQAALLGCRAPDPAELELSLEDGVVLELGALEIHVLHTPGHSPGSVGLLVQHGREARLVAGDTLFRGGVGRTDLWGGDSRALLRSIREKLLVLPDPTVVIPGHGSLTTIGEERANNPFLLDPRRS